MGQRIRVIGARAPPRGSMARGRLSRRLLRRGHWTSRSLAPYLVAREARVVHTHRVRLWRLAPERRLTHAVSGLALRTFLYRKWHVPHRQMGQWIRVIGARATTRGSMARGRLSRRPLRRGHWASRSLAPYLLAREARVVHAHRVRLWRLAPEQRPAHDVSGPKTFSHRNLAHVPRQRDRRSSERALHSRPVRGQLSRWLSPRSHGGGTTAPALAGAHCLPRKAGWTMQYFVLRGAFASAEGPPWHAGVGTPRRIEMNWGRAAGRRGRSWHASAGSHRAEFDKLGGGLHRKGRGAGP